MGTDCVLKVGNQYYGLGRWYIFSSKIEHGEELTKCEALKRIRDLKRTKTLNRETSKWEERQKEFIETHLQWLLEARQFIKTINKEPIIFYKDDAMPDEYYT